MKKALCVVTLLAFVAIASADIDLFLTQQGATNTTTYVGTSSVVGSRFNQNITKISLASGATTNPGTLSHGPFHLGIASPATPVTATFYVWAHFTNIPTYEQIDPDTGEPTGVFLPGSLQIYGLGTNGDGTNGCRASGAAVVGPSATYRQQNGSYIRWANTDPLPFPFNPSTTTQSTAGGVVAPNSVDPLVKDFAGAGTDWYALIGAFTYTATGASQYLFGLANPLPFLAVREFNDQGQLVNDWDTKAAGSYYPYLTVMGVPYTDHVTQPMLAIDSIVPEPASMVLLALAGLLIRRR